jgi:hypothetical protein
MITLKSAIQLSAIHQKESANVTVNSGKTEKVTLKRYQFSSIQFDGQSRILWFVTGNGNGNKSVKKHDFGLNLCHLLSK